MASLFYRKHEFDLDFLQLLVELLARLIFVDVKSVEDAVLLLLVFLLLLMLFSCLLLSLPFSFSSLVVFFLFRLVCFAF